MDMISKLLKSIRQPQFVVTFSKLTIFFACVHFILETLHAIVFGQSFLGLLPDYIAVGLMISGGFAAMRNDDAIGILCGAWGFAFCLHYRSWAWRYEAFLDGMATPVNEGTMYVLGATLFISALSFLITLILCAPKTT
jgi:hypothetical protein